MLKPDNEPASGNPPIVLDAQYVDRLEELAETSERTARLTGVARRLVQEIDRAQIVPSTQFPSGVVNIGNTVTFRDLGTGRQTTVSLVMPEDANVDDGRISVLTPIGVALIGLAVGSTFDWETPAGDRRWFEIVTVAGVVAE